MAGTVIGTADTVAEVQTAPRGRFPTSISLTTDEALDLLAAAEEAAAALAQSGHGLLARNLTDATSALVAGLFRDFPTVSE